MVVPHLEDLGRMIVVGGTTKIVAVSQVLTVNMTTGAHIVLVGTMCSTIVERGKISIKELLKVVMATVTTAPRMTSNYLWIKILNYISYLLLCIMYYIFD